MIVHPATSRRHCVERTPAANHRTFGTILSNRKGACKAVKPMCRYPRSGAFDLMFELCPAALSVAFSGAVADGALTILSFRILTLATEWINFMGDTLPAYLCNAEKRTFITISHQLLNLFLNLFSAVCFANLLAPNVVCVCSWDLQWKNVSGGVSNQSLFHCIAGNHTPHWRMSGSVDGLLAITGKKRMAQNSNDVTCLLTVAQYRHIVITDEKDCTMFHTTMKYRTDGTLKLRAYPWHQYGLVQPLSSCCSIE